MALIRLASSEEVSVNANFLALDIPNINTDNTEAESKLADSIIMLFFLGRTKRGSNSYVFSLRAKWLIIFDKSVVKKVVAFKDKNPYI